MRYLGIDPGLQGGFAAVAGHTTLLVAPMPVMTVKGKQQIVAADVADLLESWSPFTLALIEEQWPRPKQGAGTTFKMGYGYGLLIGALATMGIPYRTVTPMAWKKAMRIGRDKDCARFLARQLWPHEEAFKLKKNDGLAEAALIAAAGEAGIC